MSRSNSLSKGFTLLEMLLAIAILAMLSLSGWQMLQGTLSARDSFTKHNNQLQAIEYALLVIQQDFLQYIDRGVQKDGKLTEQSLFAGPDMLESDDEAAAFIRLGWHNPGQRLPRSVLQSVSYRLKDETLERQYFQVLEPEENSEPVVQPLITDVTSLKFEFYIKGRWVSQLGQEPPQAVKIIFEHKQFGLIERNFLMVDRWAQETTS